MDSPATSQPTSTSEAGIMADYGQWVAAAISNRSSKDSIIIKNLKLSWGKLYDGHSKDNEVAVGKVNNTVIKPGESYTIYSTGRAASPSGTEGIFELVSGSGGAVATIYWSCPWGAANPNIFTITNKSNNWIAGTKTQITQHGAIGEVAVTVAQLD